MKDSFDALRIIGIVVALGVMVLLWNLAGWADALGDEARERARKLALENDQREEELRLAREKTEATV